MTVRLMERSLPLRVPIRDGEAFDSWIEALARRNATPASRLLPALGLPSGALYAHHALVSGTPPATLRRIEAQTGLQSGRLDAAVFEHYDQLGWPMLDGSRFCPACLDDNDGRWPLRWRLPWVFACLHHRLLLADRCPTCGLAPRRRPAGATGLQPAAACPNLIRRGHLCGTDLRAIPPRGLRARDPLLTTQRWLIAQLDAIDTAPEPVDPETITALSDLNAVGQWRRIQSSVADYRPFGSEAVEAFTRYHAHGHNGRRPRQHEFTDALLVGATATFARKLLTAGSDEDILARLRPLIVPLPGSVQARQRPRATRFGNYYQWKTVSAATQARFLAALDPELQPVDRLRYRSCSPTPRLPQPGSGIAEQRARHIPQLLWADWAIRFTPNPPCANPDALRAAMSVCLLLPGMFEKNETKAAAQLGAFRPRLSSVILRRLVKHTGDGVLICLCRIADYLDENGAPIDYQRRRTVITADLLAQRQWQQLSRQAMTHPGKGEHRGGPSRRLLVARRYLFQLLTGADLSSPLHELAYSSPADRARHLGAVQTMPTSLRAALHQHAAAHLARLGVDEPLTWSPPANLAARLDLPGRDPDDIDLEYLQCLVIDQHRSLRYAAGELGTTLEHTRHAVEQLHRDPEPWAARLEVARQQLHQQRRELLTHEFFEREVKQAGKTLATLRDETGIPIKEIGRYAKQVGATFVGRRPVPLDREWLSEQYLNQRRSFPDIAKELGLDSETVAYHARRFGIPSRTPGIHSHPDLITKLDPTLPADVRRAVEGQLHGWQRLKRFQQAMAYRSMTAASGHIDAHVSSLILQFDRLERDIGAQLFHRSTPRQPQQLTPRGARLINALDEPQVHELLQRHGHPPSRGPGRIGTGSGVKHLSPVGSGHAGGVPQR